MFEPPVTPPQPGPTAQVRKLWEVVGAGELTQDEEDALSSMLHEMTSNGAPGMAIVVGTQEAAYVVLTITDIVKKNAIVATLFEAPHRTVTAIFKDWLVEGIQPDGTLVSANPEDWVPPPTDEEFEAFLAGLQEDEQSHEFAALVAGFDDAAE